MGRSCEQGLPRAPCRVVCARELALPFSSFVWHTRGLIFQRSIGLNTIRHENAEDMFN